MLCIDLERRQPIDLLPDRTPEQVACWLQGRPTITVVARDRGGNYIEAVTRGAPHAIQGTVPQAKRGRPRLAGRGTLI